MKTNHFLRTASRTAIVCLLAVLVASLPSCKKESADISDLLSTVPSSASAVAGINLKSLTDKGEGKVEGSDIVALFLSGKSGIDPVGAVFFTDAYSAYITAMVADTSLFTEYVKGYTGADFADAGDGVKTSGNIALLGTQMWICLDSGTIDPKAVKSYSELEKAQSFESNGFAQQIAVMTSDISGWGKLKSLAGQMSMSDLAIVNMISGILFEDASAYSFTADFKKGEMNCHSKVLNDKGEYARYLLPADKIDTGVVKGLCENAGMVMAAAISKDLVKKLEKVGSSLGGSMFGEISDIVSSLDGTIAFAGATGAAWETSMCGVVTTDGNPSSGLMRLLSGFGDIKKEDKEIKLSKGKVAGALPVAEAADFMKGAALGFMADTKSLGLDEQIKGVSRFAFSLNPEKGGMAMKLMIKSADPDQNMLLTLLELRNMSGSVLK